VRLPHELKQIFSDWLAERYPTKAAKVLGALREARGGRLNDPRFGSRMRGSGPRAELLEKRFEVASRRLGLDRDPPPLDVTAFCRPSPRTAQPSLFD
jgi:DNA repair photolyase